MSDSRSGSSSSWDDYDDLDHESVPEGCLPAEAPHERSDPSATGLTDHDEYVDTLLVTARNPDETVLVTALLSGQVLKVELSPQVASMTESQLAEEISVISIMARRQALAAQHALAANLMVQLGHDRVATRAYLEHDLRLPSPQAVLAERSELFATRYADEH